MQLDSIRVQNYRGIRDLSVEFDPHFNVLVGVNGSGKTSVLMAVCELISEYTHHISAPGAHRPMLHEAAAVRIQVEDIGGRFRFEPQFPITIEAKGVAFQTRCDWTISKQRVEAVAESSGTSIGSAWRARVAPQIGTPAMEQQQPLPIIAFYRSTRTWFSGSPDQYNAVTRRFAKMDGYASWFDASADQSFQVWIISKCIQRLEESTEKSLPFDAITNDELALVNRSLSNAIEGLKGLRYDFKQSSLLVDWTGRPPTEFQHLSDGQRAVVALISDMARRICLLNPHLGDEVVIKTPGIILIDEFDLHLHPVWQRMLTSGLKKAFPLVQFIVASHSPQVLGELRPNEIILLSSDRASHPEVSFGLDSGLVLEIVMGASRQNSHVAKQLAALFTAIEQGDLPGARQRLESLKVEAPGIPELDGADALLHRKELIGR